MKLDLSEPLRYLGVRGEPDPDLLAELSAVADKLTQAVTPRYVWWVFPIAPAQAGVELTGSGVVLTGGLAQRMLADCAQAVLLICTLGAGFETLLRAEQARSMARAAMLDACGSAWVEAGCDAAEEEISARFPELHRTDRFSPGYGDLPLVLQKDICTVLDAPRRLGVQVTDSLLMNPSKSVTAVIGLSERPQAADRPPDRSLGRRPKAAGTVVRRSRMTSPANDDPRAVGRLPDRSFARRANDGPQPTRARGCAFCDLRETCAFRKEGKTCGA